MKAILSPLAGDELKEYLKGKGLSLEFTEPLPKVHEAISLHPDICFCQLGAKGDVFRGDAGKLGEKYPADVLYNACSTGRFFMHRLKYTAPELLRAAEERGLELIDVPQGYAKCSVAVVSETAVITYDSGIAKAAEKHMDVLLVSPEGVLLPGFSRGFIGGCSGLLGNELIFNGDITAHPDYGRIKKFAAERGVKIIGFKSYPLTDIGSLLFSD